MSHIVSLLIDDKNNASNSVISAISDETFSVRGDRMGYPQQRNLQAKNEIVRDRCTVELELLLSIQQFICSKPP